MIHVFGSARRFRRDIRFRAAQSGAALRCAAMGAICAAASLVGCGGKAVEDVPGPGVDESGGGPSTGGHPGTGGSPDGSATGGISDSGSTGGSPDALGWLKDVAFAEGRFVAVGLDPTDAYPFDLPGKTIILTSEDGRHWTRPMEGEEGSLDKVAYGGGAWVAAGWGNADITGTNYMQTVLTSHDGISWLHATPPPEQMLYELLWTGSEFLMEGFTNDNMSPMTLWSSLDGTEWTPRTPPEGLADLAVGAHGILNAGDRWKDGARVPYISFSSDSGTSWSDQELPVPAWISGLWADGDGFQGAAYVYDNSTAHQTYFRLSSADGLSWQQTPVPGNTVLPNIVAHGTNGVSVGVGSLSSEIATGEDNWVAGVRKSPDGEWTAVDYPFEGHIDSLAFGAGVFVGVGQNVLIYSEDGVTWREADSIE